jgi:hypothetical protein
MLEDIGEAPLYLIKADCAPTNLETGMWKYVSRGFATAGAEQAPYFKRIFESIRNIQANQIIP